MSELIAPLGTLKNTDGYIPSVSQQTPSVKKRRKSNSIQTIILSENVELVINKVNLSVALYKNKELVRAMSLEVK